MATAPMAAIVISVFSSKKFLERIPFIALITHIAPAAAPAATKNTAPIISNFKMLKISPKMNNAPPDRIEARRFLWVLLNFFFFFAITKPI